VRIVTDSTSYLPPEVIRQYEIDVVPLEITLGDLTFREGEISNREYYARLRTEKIFPTTSQPPVGDFMEAFKRYGPGESYLCLVISELLSGTKQSAETAASLLPDYDITVMDSRSTATGLGFLVIRAAQLAGQGLSKDEIIQELAGIRSALKVVFVVDNLEYLVRGGRLSRTSGVLGNLLQVKPILGLVDGRIEPLDKVRTKARAVQRIVQELEQRYEQGLVSHVSVVHVDQEAEGRELAERVQGFFKGPILFSEAGPTIGSHTGPGTLGLIYY